jgi:hypothetical protein
MTFLKCFLMAHNVFWIITDRYLVVSYRWNSYKMHSPFMQSLQSSIHHLSKWRDRMRNRFQKRARCSHVFKPSSALPLRTYSVPNIVSCTGGSRMHCIKSQSSGRSKRLYVDLRFSAPGRQYGVLFPSIKRSQNISSPAKVLP